MPSTYTPIATTTLSTTATDFTFSGIPGTYTDLVLEMSVLSADYTAKYLTIQFNGDTTTNYSGTYVTGDGTTLVSVRDANASLLYISAYGAALSNPVYPAVATVNILSYASTSVLKTIIYRTGQSQNRSMIASGLWRKTPEAITSIKLAVSAGNMAAGTVFSLYGIKAA